MNRHNLPFKFDVNPEPRPAGKFVCWLFGAFYLTDYRGVSHCLWCRRKPNQHKKGWWER